MAGIRKNTDTKFVALEQIEALKKARDDISGEIAKVIVGQKFIIEDLLIALFSQALSSYRCAGSCENAAYFFIVSRA